MPFSLSIPVGVSGQLQLVADFLLHVELTAQLRMFHVERDLVQVHLWLERQTRASICAMVLTLRHVLESSEKFARFKLLGLVLF